MTDGYYAAGLKTENARALAERLLNEGRVNDAEVALSVTRYAEATAKRVHDLEDEHTDFVNAILAHAPDHYDRDEAAESIALEYVRNLVALALVAKEWTRFRRIGPLLDALDELEGCPRD